MDKLEQYRQAIRQIFLQKAQRRAPEDPVQTEAIFDIQRDRYQLVNVGWKNSSTRIYGCLTHVDIQDGKIWVQHDTSEDAIADQLAALGIPKQDIVLAYHAPHVRQHTEFAVG